MENEYNSKKFKENLQKYEEGQKVGKLPYMDADDLTDIAEYYHNNGNMTASREVVDYAISLFPGSAAPLALRARIALHDDENYNAAHEYAEQIADKTDFEYYYITAEIMLVKDMANDADTYLKSCMNGMDKEDINDFTLDCCSLFTDFEYFDIADKWLKRCNDIQDADYQELKGRIAINNGNYKESERIYDNLIDKDPFSTKYWNGLASSQMMQNEINDAITSSEYSIALDPNNAQALFSKANGLFELGNFEDAYNYYNRYSTNCPDDESGVIASAICMFNMKNEDEGIILLKRAEKIAIKEGHTTSLMSIYKELAYAESMRKNLVKAIEYIDRVDSLFQNFKDKTQVIRGYIYLENQEVQKAENCFKKAMEITKNIDMIVLGIGIAYYDNGNIESAFKILTQIKKDASEEIIYKTYPYIASFYHKKDNEEKFLKYLKLACEKAPEDTRDVLGELFPEDINPKDYYSYTIKDKSK